MKPLSIYIHIPFCERRCGYCDFLSCCDLPKIDAYVDKLVSEIKAFDLSKYEVRTIYLGGGTPSLLTEKQLKKIFAVLPKCCGEVTIEANPNSLTETKCGVYRALGINRLSLGVQSFNNNTLRDLGRIHDVKQAYEAINIATRMFDNVSIDLIKDIPGHQFVLPPAAVLAQIQHISIYSLTKNDAPVLETDEKVLLPKSFQRYEVSNYAKKGFESQHNLVYWTGGDYIGFGAGAHSKLGNLRFCNSDDILDYQRVNEYELTPETIRREKIMLGLRLHKGFDKNLLINKEEVLEMLVAKGMLKIKNQQVIATTHGLRVLNQLWLYLV